MIFLILSYNYNYLFNNIKYNDGLQKYMLVCLNYVPLVLSTNYYLGIKARY